MALNLDETNGRGDIWWAFWAYRIDHGLPVSNSSLSFTFLIFGSLEAIHKWVADLNKNLHLHAARWRACPASSSRQLGAPKSMRVETYGLSRQRGEQP